LQSFPINRGGALNNGVGNWRFDRNLQFIWEAVRSLILITNRKS